MSEPDYVQAHEHCIRNHTEILSSDCCGCFFCLTVFPPGEINRWLNERDGSQTAVCPKCGIDSVIGSHSGYPINHEFLETMEKHWFGLRAS